MTADLPNPDAAARRIAAFLEGFGEGVIDAGNGHVLHTPDLAALLDPEGNGPDWPVCGLCGNHHPLEPADPAAFAERYLERFRAENLLSRTDTEAVLTWARCIVARHRETVLDKMNLERQYRELSYEYQARDLQLRELARDNENLNLQLAKLRAAPAPPQPTEQTSRIEFGVRDRYDRVTERPDLESAISQYDNMIAQAHDLGLTRQDLGAAVVEREVLTLLMPWRSVEFEDNPPCPDCGGSGGHGETPCNTCGGNYNHRPVRRVGGDPDFVDPWAAAPAAPRQYQDEADLEPPF